MKTGRDHCCWLLSATRYIIALRKNKIHLKNKTIHILRNNAGSRADTKIETNNKNRAQKLYHLLFHSSTKSCVELNLCHCVHKSIIICNLNAMSNR